MIAVQVLEEKLRFTSELERKGLGARAAKNLANVHCSIAMVMANGELRCRACGKTEGLSLRSVFEYIQNGWPECCEQSMCYEGPTPLTEAGA
ncbi:MAG TPA: hypothetical protein VN622_11105 [Clostridia bacterium]|nr:hypothetical protein [Clostridia bacterium]